MSRRTALHIVVTAAILGGCARTSELAAQRGAPPVSTSTAIATWLECVECTAEQLNAVAALGNTAVPELGRFLLNGPDQPRVDAQQRYLERRYRDLKAYERERRPSHTIAETQDEYVQAYLAAYRLRIRARSARALGAIGTADAKAALSQGLVRPDVPDALRKEINAALLMKTP